MEASSSESSSSEASSSEASSSGSSSSGLDLPAGSIDLSYDGPNGRVTAYAEPSGGGYRILDGDGNPMGIQCSAVGSPSGATTYRSKDGSKAGAIVGIRASNGAILYGVMALEGDFNWEVTCKYDDISVKDGGYVGVVSGGYETPLQ